MSEYERRLIQSLSDSVGAVRSADAVVGARGDKVVRPLSTVTVDGVCIEY